MATPATSPRHLAVIGGGLSGALVVVHLLRLAPAGTRITLIERNPPVGRGVAYGTECGDHLLNVPAARMSAFADDPQHFFRWVEERVGRPGYPTQVAPDDFLPRHIYGDYIAAVFVEARAKAPDTVRFDNVTGELVDIEERPEGNVRLTLADARTLDADRVVLALGLLPGEYPIRRSMPFFHGRRYVHVPWQSEVLEGIGKDQDVLIVGAGLTANDIIVQLDRLGHRGTVHALSRRGLRPRAHCPGIPPHAPFLKADALPATIREMLHLLRAEVRKGGDWRAVIDSVRPFSHALWQGFSWEERARFMRHARPFWDVHRHRIAPQVAEEIERLTIDGRVKFYAGRLQSLRETTSGAEAVFRRRGTADLVTLNVAKVINCTGPRTDYSKYQHPLYINLLARGLIDHDPLALGLHATSAGQVYRYRNGLSNWLYAIGAPLKGVLWESTAAPEIRVQARQLAERLLA
ncbi:MAG: FAD-dependent oxidoreductase [Rariglobus sp.]|jgi:uncharacterized NAD(P)/FAD-binding protein YdhS|nr:FAD-dependent oxidoreductase [Rariglobus sp.]